MRRRERRLGKLFLARAISSSARRRTAYFTEQLYAALTLIDRGILSAGSRGSMHGEIGHTQFLPKNILTYGAASLDTAVRR